MKPVLICGGVGTKMWPASRQKSPKHFLPFIKGKSLYQITYENLLKKFKPDQIYIQTIPDQAETALKQAPGVPRKNCFIEPELRNQGPAMGYMAVKLSTIDANEPFILIQVDVLREPGEKFLEMIEQCNLLVKSRKKLITGGIRPDYLIGGVDYLLAEQKIKDTGKLKIFQMKKWLDRNDDKRAIKKYFKQRSLFAHANHYCWTPRLLLEAYDRWAPDWYKSLENIKKAFGKKNEEGIIKREYLKMVKDRVEKITSHELSQGYVVELPFRWIDFGTWESLAKYNQDQGISFASENLLEIDSKNCFIYQSKRKFVATIGVENLVIIDVKDGLLICHKNQTERVGEVVENLRARGRRRYL